jgi:hypothetical protein
MPTNIYPALPTNPTPLAIGIVANIAMSSRATLDLKTKRGATVLVRIGRRAATTPSRAGYVAIRNTDNDTIVHSSQRFDVAMQGPTTAAASTTLSAGSSAGTNTVSLNSATGFAVGDTVCISTSGGNMEFNRIVAFSGTTFTLEFNLRLAAASGATFSNLAEIRSLYIPGGDIYEIRAVNYSGLDLVFEVQAVVDEGDQVVT